MGNFLGNVDNKIARAVVKFAIERYGNNREFIKKTWGLSHQGICKLYFREYINWLEYKGGDKNGIE